MKKSYLMLFALLTTLLVTIAPTLQAQDEEAPRIGYYLAAGADGIQQVYQLLMDGASEARQITHATSDVLSFGAAYDGLSVAYISDGQLWLQPIHTEEAEALAPITATQFLSAPVYSQDGQYIAYTDNGVWLLDLGTRETRQILENVALKDDGSNMGEFRIYQPEKFVVDAEGKPVKLIVDVGVWEWNTVGVYDLASGKLQEFAIEGQVNTSLLPLSDGRVLMYGNTGASGEFALHMADSLDDINTYMKVLDFASLDQDALWANQALEIAPGIVRVFGSGLVPALPSVSPFYFDYDATTGTADEVHYVALSEDIAQRHDAGQLSPDGSLIPVYTNANFNDYGGISGEFKLLDLTTGQEVSADFPASVGGFIWQE